MAKIRIGCTYLEGEVEERLDALRVEEDGRGRGAVLPGLVRVTLDSVL